MDERLRSLRPPTHTERDAFVWLLLQKARSGLVAAVRLASAGQIPESYMLLRGAVEAALTAHLIAQRFDLAEVWLRRHDSDASMKEVRALFGYGRLISSLREGSADIAEKTDAIYQKAIDYGAHPNERSLTAIVELVEDGNDTRADIHYLSANESLIAAALEDCIAAAEVVWGIANLSFPGSG